MFREASKCIIFIILTLHERFNHHLFWIGLYAVLYGMICTGAYDGNVMTAKNILTTLISSHTSPSSFLFVFPVFSQYLTNERFQLFHTHWRKSKNLSLSTRSGLSQSEQLSYLLDLLLTELFFFSRKKELKKF